MMSAPFDERLVLFFMLDAAVADLLNKQALIAVLLRAHLCESYL